MFRRKKNEGGAEASDPMQPERLVAPVAKPASSPASVLTAAPATTTLPNRIPTMPPRPPVPEVTRNTDLLRRPSELAAGPGAVHTPPPAPVSAPREAETRQLIVGREITLQGEIKACDVLIVEGTVEANLTGCREVNVAETGLFRGSASVETAEIRGRFEGNLTAHGRLSIRATGSVTGSVRYGEIEIEAGGLISGDFQRQTGVQSSPVHAVSPVSEPAPAHEESLLMN